MTPNVSDSAIGWAPNQASVSGRLVEWPDEITRRV
jgi:hypothetical protein